MIIIIIIFYIDSKADLNNISWQRELPKTEKNLLELISHEDFKREEKFFEFVVQKLEKEGAVWY